MLVKKNKIRKAFTMVELIVYMILVGLVLYPMVSMMSFSMVQLKENNDRYMPTINYIYQDIYNDNTISTSVNLDEINNEISFTRLDECVITYKYVNNTIKRISNGFNSCTPIVSGGIKTFPSGKLGLRDYTINHVNMIDDNNDGIPDFDIFRVFVNSNDNYQMNFSINKEIQTVEGITNMKKRYRIKLFQKIN